MNDLSTDEQINAAIDLLRRHGYSVELPKHLHRLESPGEFRIRLSISTTHFMRRIEAPDCPAFFADRGPSGRILRLRSNPDLDGFMAKRKGGSQ